jgi:C4-dicarboxylate-specific signal transduction histidine kinase
MRDAMFMGRLTASATHEMQNILATIRESGGLMEDLLALGGENFAHAERFKKGLCVLAEQVERGMALSEQLNYCAHAPEATPAGTEVNEAMRSLVGLCRRDAARGRVALVLVPGRTGLRTSLRALELMTLLGLALDCSLPHMARDSQLMLSVEEQGGLAVVRLDAPGFEALRQSPGCAELIRSAKQHQVGLAAGPGGQGLVLSLPKAVA